jgi:hypothetical protein
MNSQPNSDNKKRMERVILSRSKLNYRSDGVLPSVNFNYFGTKYTFQKIEKNK